MEKQKLKISAPGHQKKLNPFNPSHKGKYFVYFYGESISYLSNTKDNFTLEKLGKSSQANPNLSQNYLQNNFYT